MIINMTEKRSSLADFKKENLALKREIKNLKSLVWLDFLTRVYNRQAFYNLIKASCREISFAKKHRNRRRGISEFSLILFDIDDFKKYNDEHGHLSGDRILKKTAALIKNSVREMDLVARWGGEEFVAILRGTKSAQAKRKAEFILSEARKKLPVTLSAGLAQSNPKYTPAEMFKKADRALYRAKRLGKDRVAG